MSWLGAVWREIVGLFVDDGRFALSITVWLVLTGLLRPAIGPAGSWAGLILFAGLAAILLDSVTRRARVDSGRH